MSEVTLGAVVSLAEAADMVEHIGPNLSYIFQGEMGIGKSAILQTLSTRPSLSGYRFVYAETQTFDVGDVSGCPFTELINGVKVTRFAPNILTGVHEDKPIIFMADEIGEWNPRHIPHIEGLRLGIHVPVRIPQPISQRTQDGTLTNAHLALEDERHLLPHVLNHIGCFCEGHYCT